MQIISNLFFILYLMYFSYITGTMISDNEGIISSSINPLFLNDLELKSAFFQIYTNYCKHELVRFL